MGSQQRGARADYQGHGLCPFDLVAGLSQLALIHEIFNAQPIHAPEDRIVSEKRGEPGFEFRGGLQKIGGAKNLPGFESGHHRALDFINENSRIALDAQNPGPGLAETL